MYERKALDTRRMSRRNVEHNKTGVLEMRDCLVTRKWRAVVPAQLMLDCGLQYYNG